MKTKFYICILLFLLVCNCFSFTNKKGSCLLLPQNKFVCLTDDYDNVVDSIINDSVNDRFPLISIYDMRDGKAFVDAEFIDDSTKHIGWIDIDNLGIFLIPLINAIKIRINTIYTKISQFFKASIIYGEPSLADSIKLKSKNVLVIEKYTLLTKNNAKNNILKNE